MKNGAFRRALGLTFLYIGLFVIIVLVQFSKGPGLSEKIGGLSVSATYAKSDRGKAKAAPEKVRLEYAGVSFEISPRSSADTIDAAGVAQPLALSSIDRLPNGIRIKLVPGVELKATVDKGARERFALAATAPEGISAVRLRISPARSLSLGDKDSRRGLAPDGKIYEIGLGSAALDSGGGILSLKPGDPGMAMARVAPTSSKPTKAVAPSEKLVAPAPKDPAAFKAEIASWRDKAWSGLSATRFDTEKIAWRGSDGLPSFSEKALTAYLAEALARGSYPDALARIRGARELWPARLTFLSSPFLGGLIPKMRDFESVDLAEVKRLSQLIADKSPTIFEKEGLLRFLLDRSSPALVQDLFRFSSGIDASKLTIRQAIGLLGCVADAKSLLKDEENPFRDIGAPSDRIVAAIVKSSNGFFLATEEDGSSDLHLSLLAGNYLAAYGTAASKPVLVGIGQGLIEGVIGLADAQGFAPARVLAHSGAALEQRAGSLAPEEIYPLTADNPYYPREVSFGRDGAPGLWAWTCAASLSIQATPARYVFTARFPEGNAHFLAVYGVKPFANIQLYGIDYSPDNDFESYDASGFLYNKAAGALYLKMKHKKESEDIKLSY